MIEKIDGSEISKYLEKKTRVYLAGNLEIPQDFDEVVDGDVEIGLSSYETDFEEKAHYHKIQREYMFVIKGSTTYRDLEKEEDHEFSEGDFFRINPGTKYFQHGKAGTKILFVKVPAINDKVLVDKK